MGPIEENLVVAAEEVKQWLGLSETPDLESGMYALLVTTAKQLADQFCNNPFIDPDDDEAVLIPDAVKMGTLQVLTDLNNSWKTAQGKNYTSGKAKRKKIGDVEVEYFDKGIVSSSMNQLSDFAKSLLSVYRFMPI